MRMIHYMCISDFPYAVCGQEITLENYWVDPNFLASLNMSGIEEYTKDIKAKACPKCLEVECLVWLSTVF